MQKNASRRQFLGFSLGLAVLPMLFTAGRVFAAGVLQKITRTPEEWKKILTPQQYNILREEGTEAPFTSPLNHEKRKGIFACAGCGLELFLSDYKFDSGTGWPSFFDVIKGRIETKTDTLIGMTRTEYHCARCGGHHGHIFDDGPAPTGLRHCSNGAVLTFIPSDK